MTADSRRRSELARFLKLRRKAVPPSAVGLPSGNRRRTAGLRREEVAILAGVSPTWYTYLEQGRKINPSGEVIESLSRVLKLGPDSRRYLFQLALGRPPVDLDSGSQVDLTDIQRVIAAVGSGDDPVYAISWLCDVVAWNTPATEWYTDWTALPPARRNMLWWLLNDPRARERMVHWERETREMIARFRALSAARLARGRLDEVLATLRTSSEFVKWWDEYAVCGQESWVRCLAHPWHGSREFRLTILYTGEQIEYMVVLHSPASLATG